MIPIFALLALAGLMQAARSFAPGVTLAGGTELAFGFLLLTAYFTGKLFSKIGLPKLTGYIVAGIVAGPAVLDLVSKDMTGQLKLVGGVATSILALQAGAELNLKSMRPLLGTVARITLLSVFGTMFVLTGTLVLLRPLVPFLGALPLEHAFAVAICVGIALSAQSPAVVMALIAETRSEGNLTRVILALVVVADLAIIVSYGVASSIATSIISGNIDIFDAVSGIGWEVFGSIGVGIFFGFALGVFLVYINQGVGLFSVMICFVIAEIGHAVHLDPLIIALTAGLWLENVSRADARNLVHQFEAASLPVYLVFFALAGAKLDLVALYHLALPVAIIVITRGSSFFVTSRVATRSPDVDPIVRKMAWLGLLPQAGLALALAEIVRRTFPTFGDAAFALVVGVVATNELIAPVILRVALLRSGEAGRRPDDGTVVSH
ncbi:MAG: cation:proton antiporter [Deltaproteobacteria bacterium]|nr:cation:proton antiporter [Kofleriaceae bacterium]